MNHDTHQPNPPLPLDAELEARVVAWVAGELPTPEVAELQQLAAVNPAILLFKRRMEAVQDLVAEAERADTAPLRLSLERRAKLLRTLGATESTAPLSDTVVVLPRLSPWSWRAPRLYFMASGLAAAVLVGLFIWQSQQTPLYRSTATLKFEKPDTVLSTQSVVDTAVRSDKDMNTYMRQLTRGLEKGYMVSPDPVEQKKRLAAAEAAKQPRTVAVEMPLPAELPASSAPGGSPVAQAPRSRFGGTGGVQQQSPALKSVAPDKAILTWRHFGDTNLSKEVNPPVLTFDSATGKITQTGAITSTNSATPNAAYDITLPNTATSLNTLVLQGGASGQALTYIDTSGFRASAVHETGSILQGSGSHSVAGVVAFDSLAKDAKPTDPTSLQAIGPGANIYLAGNPTDVQGDKFFGNSFTRETSPANAPGANAVSNGATTSFGTTGPVSVNLVDSGGSSITGGGLNVITNAGSVVLTNSGGRLSITNAASNAAGETTFTEGGTASRRIIASDINVSAGTNTVNYGGGGQLNFAFSPNTVTSADALSFGTSALSTGGSVASKDLTLKNETGLILGADSMKNLGGFVSSSPENFADQSKSDTAPSNSRPTTFSYSNGVALNETEERQKPTLVGSGGGGGSNRTLSASAGLISAPGQNAAASASTPTLTEGRALSFAPPIASSGAITENNTLNRTRAEDRDVVQLSEFTVAESPVSSGAGLGSSNSSRTAAQLPGDGVVKLEAFSVQSADRAKAKATPSAKVTIGSAIALGAVNLPEPSAGRGRSAADKSQPRLPSLSDSGITYTPNRPAAAVVPSVSSPTPAPASAPPASAPGPDRDPPRPVERPSTPPPPLEESATAKDPVSTFSLHVSDVSFRLAQAALARGELPDPARIRAEEFYNAFDYGDPSPTLAEKVGARIEQAAHPFLPSRNLVRVALKVPAAGRGASTPLHLTVLLDTSGSMEREDRAASVRRALEVLISLLGPNDRITLIGFARTPRLLAENLAGNQARSLLDILARTPSEGGTNLEEAIKLGGELARRHFAAGAQNRLVLLTDGAANLGNAVPAQLGALVETLRQQGLAFDACGVGLDGLDDEVLEALTRQGDGRYYALNSPDDADAGFAQKLAGAFRPAAENVKVQVRFNPARVGHYRLIGFEQHRLREQDFRNDQVDAAELAAEDDAVALYQVELLPAGEGEIGELFVRFRDPASRQMVERSWTLPYDSAAPAFTRASPTLQLAGASALLAEKLRGGLSAEPIKLRDLVPVANSLRGHYAQDARVQQFVTMLAQARRLLGDAP